MLIIGFLLFTASLYYVFMGLAKLITWYGVESASSQRLARIITLVVAGLTALQSMGELSSRDILLLLPFTLLAYLYRTYNGAERAS